ncbi:MAG: site-2 protease family protein [Planctomycetes bacterium]|nr:site-2 protease family protein [Planctomycetota bacterium]
MRWSIKIGRIAGIGIYMHLTFLLLLGWFALSYYLPRRSAEDALWGVAFTLAVFGVIVLHELGHALAARHYGIETRDITLLPIGGVARLARMPEEPKQELVVAVAGPLVNVVIAGALFAGIVATGGFGPLSPEALQRGDVNPVLAIPFAERLFFVNVFLVLFNMIPAFPMDGGRVLRAVLAMFMGYAQATSAAALVGQGIAFLFGAIGLFGGNPMLLFIALFVWIGAAAEASVAQLRSAIAGLPVRRAMIRDFVTLSPTEPLRAAADQIVRGYQADFPVAEGERVVGILTLQDVLAGLSKAGPDAPVGDVMRADFRTSAPGESLDTALARLREGECPVMPVLDGGRLVGLLTVENVGELVMIREAVRAGREAVPRPLGPAAATDAMPAPQS